MGKTMAEEILGSHAGREVSAGEVVICRVDFTMSQDGTSGMTIDQLRSMGATQVHDPQTYAMVIDHNSPSPLAAVSNIHTKMRTYCREVGCILYDIGEGISHQILPEHGHCAPGELVLGADSHSCTYGAFNCASTGVGSSDLAAATFTGKLWFKVPASMKLYCHGSLPKAVYAKDLILNLVGDVTADGATYLSVEYLGPVIAELSIDDRMCMANMAVEMGAKFGLMEADAKTLEWLKGRVNRPFQPVTSDADAEYAEVREYNASHLVPMVAKPHSTDNVAPVEEVEGTAINQGNVGTCTNGRLSDIEICAKILKGKHVHPDCRFIINPASKEVMVQAMNKGYVQTIVEAGGVFVTPGCGDCVGTHNGIPADGETVISTANRNFLGRMGNPTGVGIYLASPATVAASVLHAKITDPRKYVRELTA